MTFEEIVKLVDQLPKNQQAELIQHLQKQVDNISLTIAEKMHRLRNAQINVEINEIPSVRREDWYDDDGR